MARVDWRARVLEKRTRLITLIFPDGHGIDGARCVEIRRALDELELANYRAGERGVDVDEPAPEITPEEVAAAWRAVEERSAELEEQRRRAFEERAAERAEARRAKKP